MKKNTKSALLLSVVSIIVCCTMLLGTTMAWFTDSVTSARNQIIAGNLDVELTYEVDDAFVKVTDQTELFSEVELWEPGVVVYETIKVANVGNLALVYNLELEDLEYNTTTVEGKEYSLLDVIKVGITTEDVSEMGRDDLVAAVGDNWVSLDEFVIESKGELYPAGSTDEAGNALVSETDATTIVLYWAPGENDNLYNLNNDRQGDDALYIEFGLNLFATQLTYEEDSFDETYDEDAYVATSEHLAALLTANEENILVVLATDIDLPITSLGTQTPGSGEYKLGGEDTKSIVIDLNGNELNITTNYWSALGAVNSDAKITIKNGSMTSTGNSAGTWNAWDLRFCNCDYVFENVVFEKAVALDNAGKSTTMTNVIITDDHNTDTYGLWITAEGQNVTLDGCTIDMLAASDGRGIKIDNQYVAEGDEKQVTLTVKNTVIKTEEKAAILVKSTKGAEIELENVDISGVAADPFNTVWVDEDADAFYNDVTVTNNDKIRESDAPVALTTNDALDAAISGGSTKILLGDGTFTIPASAKGKTLTIVGNGDTNVAVTKVGNGGENVDYGLDGSTVTFENITITTNSSTYIGYARLNATYNNCTINGTYTLYGNSTFNNCTFNVSGDVYNIWTWGAPEATFNNCTFNSDGKALLLYGTANTELTVNGCTFNDNGGLTDLKAAIEIGNDYGKSYNLIVNNTTVNGYEINDKGINTGTTLWANKNSMGTDKLNVVIDGVDVY